MSLGRALEYPLDVCRLVAAVAPLAVLAACSRHDNASVVAAASSSSVPVSAADGGHVNPRLTIEHVDLPARSAHSSSDCVIVKPDTDCLNAASRLERCVILHGGVGAILIPEESGGRRGFRLLRPFSFVRHPNDSFGLPSWQALDAVRVDEGCCCDRVLVEPPIRTSAPEQLFEDATEIRGIVRGALAITP